MIFLIETKRKSNEMDFLRSRWKFDKCFSVNCLGRGGGLAMLWMNDVNLEIKSFYKYHIDTTIEEVGNDKSWDIFQTLSANSSLPWLCAGDFNEIISDVEKLGGARRPLRQMNSFRDVLEECSLNAIKTSGANFTWSRGSNSNMIFERLDRGLAMENWFDLFPYSCERHLIALVSDHVPLLFNIAD